MSKLLDAYFILGVAPAIALTAVQERYKWLASVYHPDRFSASKKDKAEEEMKRVNDARDTIKQHFAITHPNNGAQCHCFKISFAAVDNAGANKDSAAAGGFPWQDHAEPKNNGQQNSGFNSEERRSDCNEFGSHQEQTESSNRQSHDQQQHPDLNPAYGQTAAENKKTDESSVGLLILAVILCWLTLRYGSAW